MIRNSLARLAALCAAVAGLSACDDTLGLRASLSVAYDTLTVYSLSESPISYPSAYSAGGGIVVRVDPNIAFDIAFDLQGAGRVQLIPARRISGTRRVGGAPSATPRVGMQRISGSFEGMTKAPTGGYTYDSTFVVAPGEGVVLELASDACQFSLAQQLYAKVVVDSVVPATRQIFFRAVRDPNCGFRSFEPGVPKS